MPRFGLMAETNDSKKVKAVYSKHNTKGLHKPLGLEDGRAPGMAKAVMFLGTAFFMAFVFWGSLTELSELALAPGEVKPVKSVHAVQHLEGGQIKDIYVEEGQVVEEGAPIVHMSETAAVADLQQLKIRKAALALTLERYDALLERRPADFGEIGDVYPILREDQQKAYNAAIIQAEASKDELGARIALRSAEVKGFEDQLASIEQQMVLIGQQIAMKKELLDQQLVARTVYLEVLRQKERLNESRVATRGQLQAGRESLEETRIKLAELDTELDRTLSIERSKISAEHEELQEVIGKQKDRVKRLVVRAPVRGVIQSLSAKSIGQVLKPGEPVASLVPLGSVLIAEVQIRPDDIGHVAIGHEANVKITTFDPVKFGAIKGRVRHISPTTFLTDDGQPYYKGVIDLETGYVGLAPRTHRILPGMIVQAEIVTGAKSLMRYLLRPLYRTFSTSFSER